MAFYVKTAEDSADEARSRSRRLLALLAVVAVVAISGTVFAISGTVFGIGRGTDPLNPIRTREELTAKLDAIDARHPIAHTSGDYPYGGKVLGAPGKESVTQPMRWHLHPEWVVERRPDGSERWTEARTPGCLDRPATVIEFDARGLPSAMTVGDYDGASDLWKGTKSWGFRCEEG